jgi:hypothetical protein
VESISRESKSLLFGEALHRCHLVRGFTPLLNLFSDFRANLAAPTSRNSRRSLIKVRLRLGMLDNVFGRFLTTGFSNDFLMSFGYPAIFSYFVGVGATSEFGSAAEGCC